MNENIDRALRNLDLPSDVVEFMPKVSIISNVRILIENHNGIKLYTEEEIIIKCKKINVNICGTRLTIREITNEYVYIFGKINFIKYTSWE